MPTKSKGGNKQKKQKNGGREEERRDLIFREDGQQYGSVTKMLGDRRVQVYCFDNVERIGLIRKALRVWINVGDIVLVSLRDFQDSKADVIHRYTAEEARTLVAYDELPASTKINQTAVDMALNNGNADDDDAGFVFEDI
eukprot:TRINITY_DN120307_c0_g1_i1.p1 TRINITY_DN120307_c0_g1~~TRINITY_DN120307_c0_g1_i1.p1  ORF type:complete len:140 (+),score=10.71 TRINITY_DN120307_c0_g1_i1:66-485(+)